jgi:hypothetical protein
MRLPILAVLLLAACATQQSAEGAFANRAAVSHPEALFDVAPRSDLLRSNDGRTGRPRGERVCPRPSDLVDIGPLVEPSILALAVNPPASRAPRDFARALNASAYRLLLDQDMGRAARDIAALRAHADSNAWMTSERKSSTAGPVIDGMGALLPAWHILRQTSVATDADRQAIDGWLLRAAGVADGHPGENNAGTFRGANDMLLGLIVGDGGRYERGMQSGFYRQLGGMRADGSFPLEADRGVTALETTSRNIGLLVYSARIAESQGQDIYTAEVGGRGIDDAIGFLLRAADDNSVIDRYAAANRNPPQAHPVFTPGAQVDPFASSSTRGWIKLYAARFPDAPLTEALLARVEPSRRLANDIVGGWVTCYDSPV